jgi:hypothetical protein
LLFLSVVIPHALWKQTGNRAAAAEQYPLMRGYVEFILAHVNTTDGLLKFGMLGDWNELTEDGTPSTKGLLKGRTPTEQVIRQLCVCQNKLHACVQRSA